MGKITGSYANRVSPYITYFEIQPLEDRERREENETIAQPINPSSLIF